MLSLAVVATVFVVIFLAEVPDKTALASLVLGSRYRPSWVFTGVAGAFAVHVGLAIAAGSLLTLLPHRLLEAIVAVLFAVSAVLLLREKHEEADENVGLHGKKPTFRRVAWTSFWVILVAEFGDLTQLAIASLAAKYHDPLPVGIGAVLGLWAAGGLAIVGGRGLLKLIPLKWITRVAAVLMLVFAVVSLLSAIS